MDTSRIKVILAEQTQTNNKCLAEQFGNTLPWCQNGAANASKQNMPTLLQIVGLVT